MEKIDYEQIEGFGNLPSLNTTNKTSLVDAVNEVNTKATNAATPQNLVIGNTAGDIGIGSGNVVNLKSIGVYNRVDANNNSYTNAGLQAFTNTTGSTNYPFAFGGGFSFIRSGGTFSGAFDIWASSINDNKLYYRRGSGVTTYNDYDIFASESYVNAQIASAGGNYITANTNQTGLSGNKTTSGVWTFNNNLIINSNNASANGLNLTALRPGGFSAYFENTDTGTSSNGLYVKINNNHTNNTVQRWVVGANEVGRIEANTGFATFNGFSKTGATNADMLLGSGGHRPVNDFALAGSLSSFLPLAGGIMNTNAAIQWNAGTARIIHSGFDRIRFDSVSMLFGANTSGTLSAFIFRPQGSASTTGQVIIDGNGQLNTSNHGNSSQWKQAFDWGNHALAGYWNIKNPTGYLSGTLTDLDNAPSGTRGLAQASVLNNPNSGFTDIVVISQYSSTDNLQLGLPFRGNDDFRFRNQYGSVFSPWRKLIHDGNISTYIPAQVNLIQGTGIGITGTYPNLTITNTSPNIIQTLSQVGQVVTLSNGGGSFTLPTATTYTAGTGLSLTGTTFGQTITTSGTGSFVTGITQTTNGFQVNLGNIPVLNQNTTGTAGSLSTARNIRMTGDVDWQVNFNGSANVSAAGTIASNAVDFTKIQQINAGRLLGKGSSGAGNVQEIQLGANLSMSGSGVLSATDTDTKPSTDYVAISGNGQSVSVNKSETIVNILNFNNTTIGNGTNDGDVLHVTALSGTKTVNITHMAKDGSTQGSFNTEGQTTRFLWVASIPRWVNIS